LKDLSSDMNMVAIGDVKATLIHILKACNLPSDDSTDTAQIEEQQKLFHELVKVLNKKNFFFS